jgi:putative acetyltransferase
VTLSSVQHKPMIRRATISDAAAILSVRAASIQVLAGSHYSPIEIEAWCGSRTADAYHVPIEEKIVLLDERDGEVIAFGQLDPSVATIDAIYVESSSVRRGIGRKILRALESLASERGIQALTLDASLNAIEFYRHAGYVFVNEGKHELREGVVGACVSMCRQPEC